MIWNKIKNSKFFSRKFLLALLGSITGVVTLVASEGEGDVQIIASIILIVVSVCTYIVQEAKVDAASVLSSAEQIKELIEKLKTNDDPLITASKETESIGTTEK